jgi:hypothetical protein
MTDLQQLRQLAADFAGTAEEYIKTRDQPGRERLRDRIAGSGNLDRAACALPGIA